MDKKVKDILVEFGISPARIDDLASALIKENCVIYKSELSPISGQEIQYVDGTPDKDYPLRILRAYRQNCNCRWSDTTNGAKTVNPLLKAMNDLCDKRAKLLDKAIAELSCPYLLHRK